MVLQMQKMANTVDLGIAHIAEILFQPRDFIIRHHRTESHLAPNEQNGTLDLRQYLFIVIPLGKAVKVIKQCVEIGGIKLPQASGKEQDPLTGDARIILIKRI